MNTDVLVPVSTDEQIHLLCSSLNFIYKSSVFCFYNLQQSGFNVSKYLPSVIRKQFNIPYQNVGKRSLFVYEILKNKWFSRLERHLEKTPSVSKNLNILFQILKILVVLYLFKPQLKSTCKTSQRFYNHG